MVDHSDQKSAERESWQLCVLYCSVCGPPSHRAEATPHSAVRGEIYEVVCTPYRLCEYGISVAVLFTQVLGACRSLSWLFVI